MNPAAIIATRRTFDGVRVDLWSDGVISIVGIGKRAVGLEAGWLVLGDVCLYDAAEVMALAEKARKGTRQRMTDARDYMRKAANGFRLVTHCNAMGSVGAVTWKAVAS